MVNAAVVVRRWRSVVVVRVILVFVLVRGWRGGQTSLK
jgi:hypothetical protein